MCGESNIVGNLDQRKTKKYLLADTKELTQVADEIYRQFNNKGGSEQIASLFAIRLLLRLVDIYQVSSVLELGAGIGTLTSAILAGTNASVTAYENSTYCIGELKENTKNYRTFDLITGYEELTNSQAEMLIVDINTSIFNIKKLVQESNFKVIFIEGHQLAQRVNVISGIRRDQKLRYLDFRDRNCSKGAGVFFLSSKMSGYRIIDMIDNAIAFKSILWQVRLVSFRKSFTMYLNNRESNTLLKRIRKIWSGKIKWKF